MAMAAERAALLAVPAAAVLLLWPALWNGYPIVFADSGTYLSQAIQHYAGWDRPIFYSLFMLPLHATVTVWPVVVVQALLTAWVIWRVCRTLMPGFSAIAFIAVIAALSVCTWLPWMVSELMPDLFTPLLILLLCLLVWLPDRSLPWQQITLVGLSAFMIASQQSSLPLACILGLLLGLVPSIELRRQHRSGLSTPLIPQPKMASRSWFARPATSQSWKTPAAMLPRWVVISAADASRRWLLVALPPLLAILGVCVVNLAAHNRFAISPFGNIFVLARVIYDGPGMSVLRRDCPTAHWRLCPYLNNLPPTSDDFLWTSESPLNRAGGPKAVSKDAGAIIKAALLFAPMAEVSAALNNTLDQIARFSSGDGLTAWPTQVSPWIKRDFPAREVTAYETARQQAGSLSVPPFLAWLHTATAVLGVLGCAFLLPIAFRRHATSRGFLFAVLVALPLSAAITGSLSAPHDRYQARIMWLPPFVAVLALGSLRRSPV